MSAPPVKHRDHAGLRSIERYGRDLSAQDKYEILKIIRQGGAVLDDKAKAQKSDRNVWLLQFKNCFWRVVTAEHNRALVTVLPLR